MADYLAYGGAAVASAVDAQGTLEYLDQLGFGKGDLQQARDALAAYEQERFTFSSLTGNYCDFCFAEIMGGEFDRLKDGRERCIRCSREVLSTQNDFRELFERVRRNYQTAYSVELHVPAMIRMANAKMIARHSNERFEATPGFDPRVLGFAAKTKDGYTLHIENGSPKRAAIATMAHELTHIWQFTNWKEEAVVERYGAQNQLFIYEGMAKWAEIQYLLFTKEFAYAAREEAYTLRRTDEYGVGFRIFVERYPLRRDGNIDADAPFRHPLPL